MALRGSGQSRQLSRSVGRPMTSRVEYEGDDERQRALREALMCLDKRRDNSRRQDRQTYGLLIDVEVK